MRQITVKYLVLAGCALWVLAGCQSGTGLFAAGNSSSDGAQSITGEAISSATLDGAALDETSADAPAAKSVKLVDRDVEAPDVFQVTDSALWDGRPSLGGIWVASPDAVDPERVILRNEAMLKPAVRHLLVHLHRAAQHVGLPTSRGSGHAWAQRQADSLRHKPCNGTRRKPRKRTRPPRSGGPASA